MAGVGVNGSRSMVHAKPLSFCKYRMRYSELCEGRDAPLFHWMDGEKARKVFVADAMRAYWEHEIPGLGLVTGISLSRNARFTFGDMRMVRVTFDQRRLAQAYKIVPLDGEVIWRATRGEPLWRNTVQGHQRITDRGGQPENHKFAEEFVVGDIQPLHRYVTAILLVVPDRSPVVPVSTYEACAAFADKWQIPLRTDPTNLADRVALAQRQTAAWRQMQRV